MTDAPEAPPATSATPSDAVPKLGRPDRSRPEPLWHQVVQTLSATIEDGIWQPGDQLPGEGHLCEMLGVSRITVRHALQKLEDQGLVRKEHGRGTFVRSSRLAGGAESVTSFSREMLELGRAPGSVVLDSSVVVADVRTTRALGLVEPREVLRIRRLRTGDGMPIGIQTAHLLRDVVPDLDGAELAEHSLYDLLEERFGVVAVVASEVYRVGTATEDEAALLEIEPGVPVFIVLRVTSSADGPFEFTTSTMRGDRYEIRTTLRRT